MWLSVVDELPIDLVSFCMHAYVLKCITKLWYACICATSFYSPPSFGSHYWNGICCLTRNIWRITLVILRELLKCQMKTIITSSTQSSNYHLKLNNNASGRKKDVIYFVAHMHMYHMKSDTLCTVYTNLPVCLWQCIGRFIVIWFEINWIICCF